MNTKKVISTTIKFPEAKPIDYIKFIQPKKQILIKTNKGSIAMLVNI